MRPSPPPATSSPGLWAQHHMCGWCISARLWHLLDGLAEPRCQHSAGIVHTSRMPPPRRRRQLHRGTQNFALAVGGILGNGEGTGGVSTRGRVPLPLEA
jgi:hypothetical protein